MIEVMKLMLFSIFTTQSCHWSISFLVLFCVFNKWGLVVCVILVYLKSIIQLWCNQTTLNVTDKPSHVPLSIWLKVQQIAPLDILHSCDKISKAWPNQLLQKLWPHIIKWIESDWTGEYKIWSNIILEKLQLGSNVAPVLSHIEIHNSGWTNVSGRQQLEHGTRLHIKAQLHIQCIEPDTCVLFRWLCFKSEIQKIALKLPIRLCLTYDSMSEKKLRHIMLSVDGHPSILQFKATGLLTLADSLGLIEWLFTELSKYVKYPLGIYLKPKPTNKKKINENEKETFILPTAILQLELQKGFNLPSNPNRLPSENYFAVQIAIENHTHRTQLKLEQADYVNWDEIIRMPITSMTSALHIQLLQSELVEPLQGTANFSILTGGYTIENLKKDLLDMGLNGKEMRVEDRANGAQIQLKVCLMQLVAIDPVLAPVNITNQWILPHGVLSIRLLEAQGIYSLPLNHSLYGIEYQTQIRLTLGHTSTVFQARKAGNTQKWNNGEVHFIVYQPQLECLEVTLQIDDKSTDNVNNDLINISQINSTEHKLNNKAIKLAKGNLCLIDVLRRNDCKPEGGWKQNARQVHHMQIQMHGKLDCCHVRLICAYQVVTYTDQLVQDITQSNACIMKTEYRDDVSLNTI